VLRIASKEVSSADERVIANPVVSSHRPHISGRRSSEGKRSSLPIRVAPWNALKPNGKTSGFFELCGQLLESRLRVTESARAEQFEVPPLTGSLPAFETALQLFEERGIFKLK
jgi:hypothetical protein